jgi:hypothetical protein
VTEFEALPSSKNARHWLNAPAPRCPGSGEDSQLRGVEQVRGRKEATHADDGVSLLGERLTIGIQDNRATFAADLVGSAEANPSSVTGGILNNEITLLIRSSAHQRAVAPRESAGAPHRLQRPVGPTRSRRDLIVPQRATVGFRIAHQARA